MQILTGPLHLLHDRDGPRLRRSLLSMLPAAHQREVLGSRGASTHRRLLLLAALLGDSTAVAWAAFPSSHPLPARAGAVDGLVSQLCRSWARTSGGFFPGGRPDRVALEGWRCSATCSSTGVENYLLAPRITAARWNCTRQWPSGQPSPAGLLGTRGADGLRWPHHPGHGRATSTGMR